MGGLKCCILWLKKRSEIHQNQHVTLVGHSHDIANIVDIIWAKVDLAVDGGKHLVDYISPPGYNGHLLLMRVSCSYTEFNV